MADTLRGFADQLEAAQDKMKALHEIVRQSWLAHRRVVFNGNNYSAEWAAEANRRGLPNLDHMAAAARAFIEPKNIELFTRTKIFNPGECRSRYEILLEQYIKTVHIEALTMLEMVDRSVLPAALEFLGSISRSAYYAGKRGAECRAAARLVHRLSDAADEVDTARERLVSEIRALKEQDPQKLADDWYAIRSGAMAALRSACDRLEEQVADTVWPMPGYSELLFDL